MDNKNQQSFVPKKPVVIAGMSSKKRKRTGVFTLLSVAVFVLTLAAAVGMFFYQQHLIVINDEMHEALEEEKERFDPGLVRTFTVLRTKVEEGGELLDNHVSVSSLLSELERQTLPNVRFSNLDLSISSTGNATVSMRGQTNSYGTLASQSEVFKDNEFINNIDFSGISLDQEGRVTFNFEADIDRRLISYLDSVERGNYDASVAVGSGDEEGEEESEED